MPKSSKQFRQLTEKQDSISKGLTTELSKISDKLSDLADSIDKQSTTEREGFSSQISRLSDTLREQQLEQTKLTKNIQKIAVARSLQQYESTFEKMSSLERDRRKQEIEEKNKKRGGDIAGNIAKASIANGSLLGGVVASLFALPQMKREAKAEQELKDLEKEYALKQEAFLKDKFDRLSDLLEKQTVSLDKQASVQSAQLEEQKDQSYALRDKLDNFSPEKVQKVEVVNLKDTNDKLENITSILQGIKASSRSGFDTTDFISKIVPTVLTTLTSGASIAAIGLIGTALLAYLGLEDLLNKLKKQELENKLKEAERNAKLQEEKQKTGTISQESANKAVAEAEYQSRELSGKLTPVAALGEQATGVASMQMEEKFAQRDKEKEQDKIEAMKRGVKSSLELPTKVLEEYVKYDQERLEKEKKKSSFDLTRDVDSIQKRIDYNNAILSGRTDRSTNQQTPAPGTSPIPKPTSVPQAPPKLEKVTPDTQPSSTPTRNEIPQQSTTSTINKSLASASDYVLGRRTIKSESSGRYDIANKDTKTGFSFGGYQMFSGGALPGFLKFLSKEKPDVYKQLATQNGKTLSPDELIKQVNSDVKKDSTPLMETWKKTFADKNLAKLQDYYMTESDSSNFALALTKTDQKGLKPFLENIRSSIIGQKINDLIFDMANAAPAAAASVLKKSITDMNLSDTSSGNLQKILDKIYSVAISNQWYSVKRYIDEGKNKINPELAMKEAQEQVNKAQRVLQGRFSAIVKPIEAELPGTPTNTKKLGETKPTKQDTPPQTGTRLNQDSKKAAEKEKQAAVTVINDNSKVDKSTTVVNKGSGGGQGRPTPNPAASTANGSATGATQNSRKV